MASSLDELETERVRVRLAALDGLVALDREDQRDDPERHPREQDDEPQRQEPVEHDEPDPADEQRQLEVERLAGLLADERAAVLVDEPDDERRRPEEDAAEV